MLKAVCTAVCRLSPSERLSPVTLITSAARTTSPAPVSSALPSAQWRAKRHWWPRQEAMATLKPAFVFSSTPKVWKTQESCSFVWTWPCFPFDMRVVCWVALPKIKKHPSAVVECPLLWEVMTDMKRQPSKSHPCFDTLLDVPLHIPWSSTETSLHYYKDSWRFP